MTTDEERLKLAEKLDRELDEFINSLEKKPYTEGWNEETWQQEIERHPFFMKKAPEPGEAVHPMLEGLQQLRFDPEENSTEELAEKYKEDGNYWLKHKKYRIAIMNYTEGLLQKHDNSDLIAQLYNNRSAAHYFLKNFRSSYFDAKEAIKHKSDYQKAKIRMLRCNMELNKFKEAIEDAEQFLIEDPTNKDLIDIHKQAIIKKTEKLRDQRKSQMDEKRKRQEFQALVQVLIQRRAKFVGVHNLGVQNSIDVIRPTIEPLEGTPVQLDNNGTVYWPIVFCYPEFSITDIQQQVHELETIHECLEQLFQSDDDCKPHNYTNPNDMSVYFESHNGKNQFIKIDTLKKSIKEIVANDNFWISHGYLKFYVLPKNSETEKTFVKKVIE